MSAAGPALTETFVSAVHGITASHPSGWSVQAATEPWTTDMLPLFREPFGDFIYDPQLTDHLFLGITSKPLSGGSVDEWMAPVLSDHGCGSTEPVTIDGASGLISPACLIAAVSAEDRGYVILLYVSGDEPRLKDVYNLALFKQILATVQLDPGAAAS